MCQGQAAPEAGRLFEAPGWLDHSRREETACAGRASKTLYNTTTIFFHLVFLLKNDGFSLNRIVLRDKKEKEKDGVFHAREKKEEKDGVGICSGLSV